MKFTYNPRILKQLGTELITSDEIAIMELIKNSFDAGAKNIKIHFSDSLKNLNKHKLKFAISKELEDLINKSEHENLIVIEDDGKGMDETIIKNGFFVVGTTIKRDEKQNIEESDNILLGDKGIGRLSAQRLSPILILESTQKNDNGIHIIKVEWEKFINDIGAETEDIKINKGNEYSYTRLWLIGTNNSSIDFDKYFEERNIIGYDLFQNPIIAEKPQLFVKEGLEQSLNFLFSPFHDNKLLLKLNLWYKDKAININFHDETFKVAETVHSFDISSENEETILKIDLNIKPWFLQRIHRRLLGKKLYQDWEKDHAFYGKLLQKYKSHFNVSLFRKYLLEELRNDSTFKKELKGAKISFEDFHKNLTKLLPLKGKVYSFKRDSQLLRMAVDSALAHNFITKDSSINEVRSFLDINNGVKLYRNSYRIGTIGNKEDDWLKLQQERTKGQQFYRFELGNVVGYVDINDPKQEYISETSSRQQVNDNIFYRALFILLDFIFNHKYYDFNRYASEIAKNIFEEEGLLPKNSVEEIQEQADKTEDIIKAAQANIQAFKKAFEVINNNLELDTPEKLDSIKKVLQSIQEETTNFQDNFSNTILSLKATQEILKVAEQEKQEIEIEAYNNYKLMANGLITEVITHELHSLVNTKHSPEKVYKHFDELKNYLLSTERFDLNKNHLYPLKGNYENLTDNISDIGKFYQFLEKTFLYKGTIDDYETENLKDFIENFSERFSERIKKNKIEIEVVDIDIDLNIPRGSLVHLFYNLIDNSIYWIQERKRRADFDAKFKREGVIDKILITKITNSIIEYRDTGTGILNQYQYTLFNPFVSGKAAGRGMGLYIIRRFLESFGASIKLKPELNDFGNQYIFEINFGENQQEEN